MKAYVLVSDVGLNGLIIHGTYSAMPTPSMIQEAADEAARWTGYQTTFVESPEIQEVEE